MDSDKSGNLSIDDSILEYFFKKGSITDQTEKLAIARIGSKIEADSDQILISINRLSAKNLIRKVYQQGRIGFELTPRGKSAIEALTKAETERITKQLQVAIQKERKIKLRSNIVNKLLSIEEEWQNYQIPNRKSTDETEQEAKKLLAATIEINARKPLCHTDPQNYDQQFAQYKLEAEKLAEQNNNLTKAINNYVKIKNCLQSISDNVESFSKTINKYEPIPEAATEVNQLRASLCKLKLIESQLENFDKSQLSRFEGLKTQLADNSRLLEILKKSTHEFAPIKRETFEKATLYPDPECPIIHGRKTSKYPLLEKCSKCGTTRKSTPVTIG